MRCRFLIDINVTEDVAIAERIAELKFELGDTYSFLVTTQRDSIVMHADFLGDSFMLSQKPQNRMQNTSCFAVFISWQNQPTF